MIARRVQAGRGGGVDGSGHRAGFRRWRTLVTPLIGAFHLGFAPFPLGPNRPTEVSKDA